jgi:signal transduction histidine kinase/ActR/RegA family two-component response regulator
LSNENSQSKINILMVDDQPGKLLSYEVILKELGENLLKASSARAALEHLLRTEIAVVLIDVCMPELDGFELAGMIREHPRFEKTAIIFVSAVQITDLDRLRGYAAGAVDYVPVPVVPEVLRAKVKVFAELYRKTRQLEQLNSELERRVADRTAELEASALQLRALNEDLEQRIEERTREREQALAQLFEAQKLDTIGKLTGGVAHDFNNLLTAVLGSLELLAKRLPDDPRAMRLLENAVQGAKRGASLTQRLLAFARRQDLKPESVDLVSLVDGMEDLFGRALGPGVRLAKFLSSDLPPVRVDANQLELALLNLVVNARDAMPLSGSLTLLATASNVDGERGPKDLVQGKYVKLSLIDTGMGMDAETLAKATEPFFTTKGLGKGTGLGLSMVHGLVMQSGGTMTIASRLGEGTTVDLWLPLSETSPMSPRSEQDAPHTGQRIPDDVHRILVVDDDPLVGTGTAEMLADLGHNVVEANSGAEAISILERDGSIELLLTDHAMPGMTGLELATIVRATFPRLPILLASGYAELPNSGDWNIQLPRLAKPYRQEELAAAISACFSAAQTAALVGASAPSDLRP